MSYPVIAPSLLSADFCHLADELAMINKSAAEWVHLDIMDGVFVPNITFGPPVIREIRKHTTKVLDVHLMISDPDRFLEAFRDAGADYLTVHFEACTHLNRTIHRIKELGMKAGVAINPHNPVTLLSDIIDYTDLILVMSVNPGFGGQKFIPNSYERIRQARLLIDNSFNDCLLQVDGGVSLDNIDALVSAGVDVLVAGNAVFTSSNPLQTISELRERAHRAQSSSM